MKYGLSILFSIILISSVFGQYPLQRERVLPYIPTNDRFLSDFLYSDDTTYYKLPQTFQHFNDPKYWRNRRIDGPIMGLFYSEAFKFGLKTNNLFPWAGTVGTKL